MSGVSSMVSFLVLGMLTLVLTWTTTSFTMSLSLFSEIVLLQPLPLQITVVSSLIFALVIPGDFMLKTG